MITINLLPEEYKKKVKEPKAKKADAPQIDVQELVRKIPVVQIGIGLLVTLIIVYGTLFFIARSTKMSLDRLTRQYADIMPQKKEAEALKSKADTINKKIKAIDELMVKRFSWTRKLNDLSDAMTPGVWLVELNYDERMGERGGAAAPKPKGGRKGKGAPAEAKERVLIRNLTLAGYASSMGEQGAAVVGRFIQGLKDNADFYADFSDIVLGSIKTERVENQEAMNFRIACQFKEVQ